MMAHYARSVQSGQTGSTLVDFWPAAFWGPAAVLTIVLVLSCQLLKNRPEDVGLPPIEKYHGEPESLLADEVPTDVAPEGSWTVISEVLTTPSVWLLALSYFSV